MTGTVNGCIKPTSVPELEQEKISEGLGRVGQMCMLAVVLRTLALLSYIS